MASKVDTAGANAEPEIDEDALQNDPEYIKRCEAVAVSEWYANERIQFEQRALGALEKYKRTGTFTPLFPPVKSKKSKLGKDGKEKAKRSISAYNLFIRYEIESLKATNSIPANAKITNTIKELGATWSNMSEKEKALKAKSLFERHQKENPGVVIPEAVLAAAKVRTPRPTHVPTHPLAAPRPSHRLSRRRPTQHRIRLISAFSPSVKARTPPLPPLRLS